MRIIEGDLGDRRVIDLLQIHVTSARAQTAPGSAHALDLAGLLGGRRNEPPNKSVQQSAINNQP